MLSECTEDMYKHVVYKYYRIFIELLINKNTCNKEKYKGIFVYAFICYCLDHIKHGSLFHNA